jgi:hypothetical protein
LLDKIQLLKNRPVPLSKGIVAAFALAMLALWIGKTLFSPEPDKISYIKTELRLQFFGGQRPPSQAHADNIFTNYSLWTPSAILEVGDKGQKIHETMLYPESWAIFVLFEKPTNYADVNVSFSNPGFPQYEVKQTTNRSLLVSVSGSIPAGFLEIYLKP